MGVLLVINWKRSSLGQLIAPNICLICGGLAFLLALGDEGIVWNLLHRLPVFSQFTLAFKTASRWLSGCPISNSLCRSPSTALARGSAAQTSHKEVV